jgi:hypothetical protein
VMRCDYIPPQTRRSEGEPQGKTCGAPATHKILTGSQFAMFQAVCARHAKGIIRRYKRTYDGVHAVRLK